jgi:Clp amino terminal domain, pathogenicity island component
MPRDLTRDTRTSVARALGHAGRIARRYVSGEHLLTVLVSAVYARRDPRPARAVLHQHGATIEDVAAEIARRAGPGAVLFGGLDRDALAAIGIDLDAVRASIESSFGPEALTQVVRREPRPPGRKGGASALMLLQRAHPDVFEDALRTVIDKAKQANSAEAGLRISSPEVQVRPR